MTSSPRIDTNSDRIAQVATAVLASSRSNASSHLPYPVMELITAFLESLELRTHAVETKELVVRALRVCVSQPHEAHEASVRGSLPLLLDPSVSLQLTAATCLLHCCNTYPSPILHQTHSIILSTITRALALFKSTPSLSNTTLRLVSTSLRILNAVFSKVLPPPAESVAGFISIIEYWTYRRPGALGTASPAPDRGRTTSGALAFGVMGAFAPPSPEKAKARHARSASSASTVVSESDDDEGKVERRFNPAQVRLDALTCLKTLAQSDSTSLYTHWGLFLSDSPYLFTRKTLLHVIETDPVMNVRLRACQGLEAMLVGSSSYLAIAEDRATNSSFISLSAKIGEIVSELHGKLASLIPQQTRTNLLTTTPTIVSPELLVELLKLADTLAQNAPYARMRRPLAQPLLNSILPLVSNADTSIAVAAVVALTSIVKFGSTGTQSLDVQDVSNTCVLLLNSGTSTELQVEIWRLLAVTISAVDSFDLTPTLIYLHSGYDTASILTQESQIAFIATLFKSPSPSLHLQPYSRSILRIIRVALMSDRSALRVLACAVLASPILADLDVGEEPLRAYDEVIRLVGDMDAMVRSAACRALGILVKSPKFEESLSKTMEILVVRYREGDVARASASWSLANCCDVLTAVTIQNVDRDVIMDVALELSSSNNGEKLQTNGIRMLGSLLQTSTHPIIPSTLEEILAALRSGLLHGPVKVRWNAARAIGHALSGPHLSIPSTTNLLQALSLSLVECTNFKVKIQSSTSLSLPSLLSTYGSSSDFESVLERVKRSKREVREGEGKIPVKEMGHWTQLILRLEQCEEHLERMGNKVATLK